MRAGGWDSGMNRDQNSSGNAKTKSMASEGGRSALNQVCYPAPGTPAPDNKPLLLCVDDEAEVRLRALSVAGKVMAIHATVWVGITDEGLQHCVPQFCRFGGAAQVADPLRADQLVISPGRVRQQALECLVQVRGRGLYCGHYLHRLVMRRAVRVQLEVRRGRRFYVGWAIRGRAFWIEKRLRIVFHLLKRRPQPLLLSLSFVRNMQTNQAYGHRVLSRAGRSVVIVVN